MAYNKFPVIMLTGISGAGKSTALKVFEDMGYFSVDGLPCNMVNRLVKLFKSENPRSYRGLALGIDARQREFLQEWEKTASQLLQENIHPQIVFLEAQIKCLLRRYAETRRPHPLESKDLGLQQALELEQEILAPLRNRSDLVIDTTDYSVHDLRRKLQERYFFSETNQGLRIHVISFGFKFGVPQETDLLFDLRFLPNPYFEEEIKMLTGKDKPVANFIFNQEPGSSFKKKFLDFLQYLLPLYAQEGRYRLTLSLGCTGGRHRSVAIAEYVYSSLREMNYQSSLEHRHLELG